jgi:hypothetical protein
MLAFGRSVVLEEVAVIKLPQVMELSTSLTDKVTARELPSVIVCAEIAPSTGASFTAVTVTEAEAEFETTLFAVTV